MDRVRAVLLMVAGYIGLALVMTWPLGWYLGTHAPGDGSDDPAIIWNLWWVRQSLTVLGQSPFQGTSMFWPLGINLVFYTLTILNGLLSIPLQLSVGLIPANSAVVLFELVIAGLGMGLMVDWLLAVHNDLWRLHRNARRGVAFVAGALFAFASSKFVYLSLGQFNIAASHWVPWAVLGLIRLWPAAQRRPGAPWWAGGGAAAIAAFFLLCNGWTEFTYAAFVVTFAVLLWGWQVLWGVKTQEWVRVGRYTGLYVLVGALFLLGMSPILALMLADMRRSGDFLVEGLGFSNVFSNDLLGFWLPNHLHPLWGDAVAGATSFAYLNFAFVGWVPLVLAGVAMAGRARMTALFWAVVTLIFGALSLGPTLRINGREWELPLPFDLMLAIPFLKANRYPSRYSVMIAMTLGVLAAYGLAIVISRVQDSARWRGVGSRRGARWHIPGLLAGVLGLALFETLSIPLPLSNYRLPPFYYDLRDAPGAALLEVPLAWRNGFRVTGTLHPQFMFDQFYQTVHGKRLLSGNTSRNPEFSFQYFIEAPLINSLVALETGHSLPPERVSSDQAVAPLVLAFLDAPMVVVHHSDAGAQVTPSAVVPHLQAVLDLTPWPTGDVQRSAWRAALPAFHTGLVVTPTGPVGRLPFAEGWAAFPPLDRPDMTLDVAWVQAAEARVLLPAPLNVSEGAGALLVWEAVSPRGDPQMQVETGTGWRASVSLAAGRLALPPGALVSGLNSLWLRFAEGVPVSQIAPGVLVPGGGGPMPAHIVVESAGLEVGNLAHIWVNGQDVVTPQPGYHLAVIDPHTGEVVQRGHFQTALDPMASAALAGFIEQVPEGFLVAVAASDTVNVPEWAGGQNLLGADAVAALEQIGARGDLRNTLRWSHAILGVKGAPPGSALEDIGAIRPARVWAGLPVTAPTVMAGFRQIGLVAESGLD